MKVLITYHTRTGNTERAAKIIGSLLESKGAQVQFEKLQPLKNDVFIKSAFFALLGREVPILNTDLSVADYDLIIIGSPVWAHRTTPPMNSYLADVKDIEEKNIAVFATMSRTGGDGVIKNISSAVGKKGGKLVGSVQLSKNDFLSDTTIKIKVKDFVKGILAV